VEEGGRDNRKGGTVASGAEAPSPSSELLVYIEGN